MLSTEDNKRLTQVSAGTPMGELLRRYWMPIAAVDEFALTTIKKVRLMGEDLVLYRDRSGTFGLVDRHCAHRRADMSYGYIEDCGLRCNYHGWLYDETGRCLSQPYEDIANPEANFKDKVRIKSYPVEVLGDIVWAYLGPEPAPLVPDWEPFHFENGFRQIVFADVPCNWFQGQENSIDPVHFEWLHLNWSERLKGEGGPNSPPHLKLAFEEFEYGHIYKRLREGMAEDHPLWSVGRVCLWPNALFTGTHFEWRVPVDDENTLSVTWAFTKVPEDCEPYVQEGTIPSWHGPVRETDSDRWITSHVMNQDFAAWAGQGTVGDRTGEHLASSDEGILMLRKRFMDDMDRVSRGEDPKAVIRDPDVNRSVRLPVADRKAVEESFSREAMLNHPFFRGGLIDGYPFQKGQPDAIRADYEKAMGIKS
jgi:5,5'-dehydrodivanillate O-demethylase